MRLLLFVCILGLSSLTYGIKVKSITNSITQHNTDLLKYNPNDQFTLPEHIDDEDDKVPSHYHGNVMRAKTLASENVNQGKGKFKYSLHTENGIDQTQVGKLKDDKTFIVSGSYSYTGGDGRKYKVRYTADEFGYHPITELDIELPIDDEGNGFQFLKRRINDNKANRGSGQLLDNYSNYNKNKNNQNQQQQQQQNNKQNQGSGSADPNDGYVYEKPAESYLPPLF